MKKIILLIILLIIIAPIYSQTYEEVVEVNSISKSELYERSLRWFVINSKDSNTTIKLQDSDKGEVYAKITFQTPIFKIRGGLRDWISALYRDIYYQEKINISAQILAKDGRYKYHIEVIDRERIQPSNNENYARTEETISKQDEVLNDELDDYISNKLIEDIKKHMSAKSSFEEKDW